MANLRIDFLYLSEQVMIKAGVNSMADWLSSMLDMFKLLVAGDYRMGDDREGYMMRRLVLNDEGDIIIYKYAK